ncbi:putative oxidoreductase C-terminal domain-containing protein [Thermoflexibacter ruber]|nr:putative oxidoreductase C-terminal domain-containing protein [Thermoflexibacter ruber]
MRKLFPIILLTFLSLLMSCEPAQKPANTLKVRLLVLNPGHFHAALVQKTMYPEIDSLVYIYGQKGGDLDMHLKRIEGYNTRQENPTHWKQEVYTQSDFLEKMLTEKKGNVVVLAGNNQKKTDYILASLENGLHVFADKPMAINEEGFKKLKKAFEVAEKNKVLLYDIMTERYEITSILQKELSMLPEIFGTLEKGSPENPAVIKESVHHFYKYVSGNVLTRPAWFLDVSQQGEGIVDVTTHLVDLVQWACFPEQPIDYTTDIQIYTAKRWTTDMGISDFKTITKLDTFPTYLSKYVEKDTLLKVFCNGEINYALKGVHAKVKVIWNYKAPEGTGDTHYSIMRGSKANLVIRQGAEENYIPTLYIEPHAPNSMEESVVIEKIQELAKKYQGIAVEKSAQGWKVQIPDALRESHEAHFARVTEKFLSFLKEGKLPSWEVPNMLAKYYTTTQALKLAKEK